MVLAVCDKSEALLYLYLLRWQVCCRGLTSTMMITVLMQAMPEYLVFRYFQFLKTCEQRLFLKYFLDAVNDQI